MFHISKLIHMDLLKYALLFHFKISLMCIYFGDKMYFRILIVFHNMKTVQVLNGISTAAFYSCFIAML